MAWGARWDPPTIWLYRGAIQNVFSRRAPRLERVWITTVAGPTWGVLRRLLIDG